MAKVLLVEDDDLVAETVLDALGADNHVTEWVSDGAEGLDRLKLYQYDLAILDWNIPRMTGPEICAAVRAVGRSVTILLLTGRSSDSEKVTGLDAGADDYLTKPFSVNEFRARVRALLRRPAQAASDQLKHGDLTVDTRSGTVSLSGTAVQLSPREFSVLTFLLRHKNELFSAADLLSRVWSSESDSTEYAVRQCIMRLRKKIGDDDRIIQNVQGFGYTIRD